MSYEIHSRETIEDSISSIKLTIDSIVENNCLNEYTGKLSEDPVQNLIYFRSGNNCKSEENTLLDIALRSFAIAESKASGSGSLSTIILSYLLSDFKSGLDKKERLEKIIEKRLLLIDYGESINSLVRKPSLRDISAIFKKYNLEKDIEKSIIYQIKNANIFTNFEVNRSLRELSSVKNGIGHYLKIGVKQLQTSGSSEWKRRNVNTVMIDGVIESVSQINHVLELAASSKESFVIICRESSDEVSRTVNLNFLRGTIDLVVIETGYSIDYHHLFMDISQIFKSDYINIKMGDTISTHINKLMFKIDKFEIYPEYLKIFSENSEDDRLSRYINDIQSIKNKIGNEDIEEYNKILSSISKRVRFLSSSSVDISIGKRDLARDSQIIFKLNRFFRSFPDMAYTGIVDLKKSKEELSKEIIRKSGRSNFTQREIFQSLITSFRVYESITKAEKVFTIEK